MLVTGAETQIRLVPRPHMLVKNLEGILAVEESGFPAPPWAPQPGTSVLGREVPTISDCEDHPGSVWARWSAAVYLGVLLLGPSSDSLARKHLL